MKRVFREMTPDDTVNQVQLENDRAEATAATTQQAQEERQHKKYDGLVQIVTEHIERVKTNRHQWEMNHFLTVLQTYGQYIANLAGRLDSPYCLVFTGGRPISFGMVWVERSGRNGTQESSKKNKRVAQVSRH
tara:strand:- start:375 stop:773 length:399 start_codon:yes stop_codon:yes gene_type:complete